MTLFCMPKHLSLTNFLIMANESPDILAGALSGMLLLYWMLIDFAGFLLGGPHSF